ncbi:MAG TPA: hypothetical protein VJT72_13890 [Pseudonocardiaceae bacterium]|nr:hypothetical protein [Pseudonocardiaceae bacterium]
MAAPRPGRLATPDPRSRDVLDGRHWVLGPLSWPGRTAGYADTRSRILAAAAHADELQEYWNYLDSAGWLPPVPVTPAGTSVVVVGLLIADILAALSGEDMPSEGNQVLVDIRTCRVERHPVRALPVVWALADREAECP